jgi:hypothetical protein
MATLKLKPGDISLELINPDVGLAVFVARRLEDTTNLKLKIQNNSTIQNSLKIPGPNEDGLPSVKLVAEVNGIHKNLEKEDDWRNTGKH